VRALRHAIERGELVALVMGVGATFAVTLATVRTGTTVGIGFVFVVGVFALLVAGWVFAPHVVAAISIPLFVSVPVVKLFVTTWIGPVKDVITLAAAVAILCSIVRRESRRGSPPVDRTLIVLVLAFVSLYVVNLGGDLSGEHHGNAWLQGIRLTAEPLILLAAGLTFIHPRRTLNVAVGMLIATGVVVALYGIYQQYLGGGGLVGLGYTYNQIRTLGGRVRSFGTLDDSFLYATFVLLAISAALFWMRRGALKTVCLSVMAIGVAVSYVRSALVISVALVALWLLSTKRVAAGLLLLGASVAAALALLFAVAGANETRSVQTGPNTYLTLNGRTTVWATVFNKPARIPFGLGVGKVGTAADRARSGVTGDPRQAKKRSTAVDSGYFATVADVGVVGLIVLIAVFSRMIVLGIAATRRGSSTGWLVLGWLTVLLIDAITRASFQGFPTAFLGMLLVGAGIAAGAHSRAPAR
jgi:O-antigen ligase